VREARDKDRAEAQSNGVTMAETANEDEDDEDDEENDDEGPHGSKIIVIHPGSQNLRIGFASDALPKTVPMVIARKAPQSEDEEHADEPRPRKRKFDDEDDEEEEDHKPEELYGEEV
jgi:actin-related protein 8